MIKTAALPSYSLQEILEQLLIRHRISSGSELAKKIKIPVPTINRLLAGTVTDPRASTLVPIAEYFGISIDQLLGKAPLDVESYEEMPDFFLRLPISNFSEMWDKETNIIEKNDLYFNYAIDKKSKTETKNLFALAVENDDFLPAFSSGTVLIVDRSLLPPENGDYIIVKFNKFNSITIKQFYVDLPNKYLMSVMPRLENVLYDEHEHQIIGVISEAHMQLK